MKRHVYLCQVNHRYGRSVFLPYSVGLLQAYVQSQPDLNDAYDFKELIFLREPIKDVIDRMDNPNVFAASLYIWNAKYTHALTTAVRWAFPKCLIILGGPHVPNDVPKDWFWYSSGGNVVIHGEGEETFAEVLRRRLLPYPYLGGSQGYEQDGKTKWKLPEVQGITFKGPWDSPWKTSPRPRLNDLDKLPSPYLTGVFDAIVSDPRYTYQVTQETHRGCPYSCTFCDWGSNLMAKVKRFGDDRIAAEYEWAAKHHVEMLYNADANYGMFERDVELTRKMVEVKKRTGYPVKFRAAYAKNSGERVFQISKMLNDAGMSKGTTLSFQSLDEGTLITIKRKNIDMSNFKGLMDRYNAEGIPTYSELIVGMPGETYNTFASGIDRILDAGQHSGINVYTAELLPNSEMSQPEYREKHGIKSVNVPQLFYHATPGEDPHREYYEIVTATGTLPEKEWLWCQLFSWAVQTLHCLGLTQCIARFLHDYAKLSYRAFYEIVIAWGQKNPHSVWGKNLAWAEDFFRGMQKGELRDPVDLRFGNVSWPPEEFGFLKIVTERHWFYRELKNAVRLLNIPRDEVMAEILDDLFRYQQAVLRVPYVEGVTFPQRYDIHGYLNGATEGGLSSVVEGQQPIIGAETRLYSVIHEKVYHTLEDYAREVVWYGRKGGAFLEKNVKVS